MPARAPRRFIGSDPLKVPKRAGDHVDPVQRIFTALFGTPLGSQVQFGDVVLPNILLTAQACQGQVHAAVSWDAVRTLYTKPKLFSSRCFVDSLGRQGPTLTTMDPPEHSKYRRVAQAGFTPAHLARFDAEVIRPSIARRFAGLRGKGDVTPVFSSSWS